MRDSIPATARRRAVGNIDTRVKNPTTDVFEQRIAAHEGGVAAVAVASGHAPQTLALFNLAQPGDNSVASQSLYGGTVRLLTHTLPRLGIRTRFVDIHDHDHDRALAAAVAADVGRTTTAGPQRSEHAA